MARHTGWQKEAFEALTGARGKAESLSEHAQQAEASNFLKHAASLSMSKSADGLFDPKLVLSWLLSHLGAGAFWIGLLVPIREAGALLPQLFTAARIHALSRRKWAWAAASLGQGIAAALIVLIGVTLTGAAAGSAACAVVALLALSRSVASVSYKDVLGKTVGKARRGAATGLAASSASVVIFLFALALMVAPIERFAIVMGALGLAALLWIGAAALFATLDEEAQDLEQAAPVSFKTQLGLLRRDPDLARFIVARGLLTGTALAPPYLILLGSTAGNGAFEALGASVLASALASFVSSYLWGRLSDRSSKTVLALSGIFGAVALFLAVAVDLAGVSGTIWAIPGTLFLLMICYYGVRQGRSTYLVDLAPEDQRPQYTAVANTLIGVILLGSGVIGALAAMVGPQITLGVFALMALGGAGVAWRLREVETGFGTVTGG
ncbi:Major Facilitator Superfamily protein [Aquimixticola soesokkakensis]|uniref:Major Facilitator Superfamily protein n=1 Tax=Aquimixticola soesokkakensis TaxID=1519096 RepID=A0A1Y5SX44_9RHOB|nr:MFS transporter [Aquimixticola soesokkakensis]SLN50132.1 Major Facilitator Superfamily protein [Aquimixticola soesokkakensis]